MDALILAGGENKRFPVIKGFLEISGKRIIEKNIELLKGIFNKVIISTNNPELYFYLGVLMVGDVVEYRGPMTGILSGLTIPEVSEVFVTACDMPFINTMLIKYIVDKWEKEYDAVIPIFDDKPQPLLGIYSKRIAKSMEQSIKNGERSLRRFLQGINVLYINEEEVRNIDPEGRSFININTIEDFQKEIGGEICLV
ncbi:MAG: molybdenum cofactor guanylyltransferase [Nitrospirota bacterium]|nr:molybdenum cofactor guanylyltransferase [Nitrospirota bacterium]